MISAKNYSYFALNNTARACHLIRTVCLIHIEGYVDTQYEVS